MMKTNVIIFLIAFFMVASFSACEKVSSSEYDEGIMQSYYVESTHLNTQTSDSVTFFSQKVNTYVINFPVAGESRYFPLIQENIKNATISFDIKIDTTWAGHIYVNY